MKDMLGREDVVSAGKALELLLGALSPKEPGVETVPLEEGPGRVCGRDIVSPEDLPAFTRSTVDGYAVKAEDTFGATEAMPAYLNLSGEVFMGERPACGLSRGEASKIPTGGMLPEGADAVVMLEHVQEVDGRMIEALRPVAPGENTIQPGEDVRRGETVLCAGRKVRPQDIGACAGLGITLIPVYARPKVAVISTGDEIVPASSRPGPGQVRDINSFVLSGLISSEGCLPLKKGIISDVYEDIRAVIEGSLKTADAVVLSGGTSVGTKDMIARVIGDLGSPGVIFHGVSLKPGKPMIGGVVDGVCVFGLPGHPAAVGICFDLFIRPVLRRLSGLSGSSFRQEPCTVKAALSRNLSSPQGREEHVRVRLEEREDGLWAVPVPGKSGLITTLVKADGTILIPANLNGLEKGTPVDVRLFY